MIQKTMGDMLRLAGLSDRSDFYLGRSIAYGDITAEKLVAVSKNIHKYLGEKKQKIFNQMVKDLPTLKPSFFIEFAVRLPIIAEDGEWWWDKEHLLKHYSNFYNRDLLNIPVCEETERIKLEFKKLMNLE